MLQRRTFAVFGVFRGVFVVKSTLIYRITELEYTGWDWDEQRRHSGSSALQEPVEPVNGRCKLRSESKELRLVDEQMVASRRGAGGQKQPRGSEPNIDKHLSNALPHANGRWQRVQAKIEWAGVLSHALRSGGERQPGKRSGGACANPRERFPKSVFDDQDHRVVRRSHTGNVGGVRHGCRILDSKDRSVEWRNYVYTDAISRPGPPIAEHCHLSRRSRSTVCRPSPSMTLMKRTQDPEEDASDAGGGD
ncbi:hypothetical protein B0H14DRAFT_2605477 [Mycena olivaceomarginata]|nr:hypothetical protein B0H14DRAFT_2605477 [Mycena olivaceomarginata]